MITVFITLLCLVMLAVAVLTVLCIPVVLIWLLIELFSDR